MQNTNTGSKLTSLVRSNSIGFKAFLIALLLLIFLIPLGFVSSIVKDRQQYKQEAINSILTPVGGKTEIKGLSVVVEYFYFEEILETENNQTKKTGQWKSDYIIIYPTSYELNFDTKSKNLTRGIFTVPTYTGTLQINAQFEMPESKNLNYENKILTNEAFLSFGIANNKSLIKLPQFSLNKTLLSKKTGKDSLPKLYENDVQFSLHSLIKEKETFTVEGVVAFQGGDVLRFIPLAGDNLVTIKSDWKTPSFTGAWIPTERIINENGFEAKWQIAGVSTNVSSVMSYNSLPTIEQKYYDDTENHVENVSVQFFSPVGSYQKIQRSIKYALLFLMIPFLTIFLFEVFFKTKIHPVQYCLIGLANIIFYLLLLSVSEHLAFNMSYFLGALSVTILISLYIASILKTAKSALTIFVIQSVSYVFLFGTLQAEDYALLIGSLGLFFVVAILMYITRKIDWYKE